MLETIPKPWNDAALSQHVPYIIYDSSGTIRFTSKLWTSLFIISPADPNGWFERLHHSTPLAAILRTISKEIGDSPGELCVKLLWKGDRFRRITLSPPRNLGSDGVDETLYLRIAIDTTQQEEAREFAELALDTFSGFIFAKDDDLRFLYVNDALQKAFNLPMQSILGRTDAELHPNNDENDFFAYDDREVLVHGRSRKIVEEQFTRSDLGLPPIHLTTEKHLLSLVGGKRFPSRCLLGISTDIRDWCREREELDSLIGCLTESPEDLKSLNGRQRMTINELAQFVGDLLAAKYLGKEEGRFTGVYVIRHDQPRGVFRCIAAAPLGNVKDHIGREFDEDLGVAGYVRNQHKAYASADCRMDADPVIPVLEKWHSCAAAPVYSSGEFWGILCFAAEKEKNVDEHAVQRVVRDISRYAERFGHIIPTCELFDRKNLISAAAIALYLQAHDIGKELSGALWVMRLLQKQLRPLMEALSDSLEQKDAFNALEQFEWCASDIAEAGCWAHTCTALGRCIQLMNQSPDHVVATYRNSYHMENLRSIDVGSLVERAVERVKRQFKTYPVAFAIDCKAERLFEVDETLVYHAIVNGLRNAALYGTGAKHAPTSEALMHVKVLVTIHEPDPLEPDELLITITNNGCPPERSVLTLIQEVYGKRQLELNPMSGFGSMIINLSAKIHLGYVDFSHDSAHSLTKLSLRYPISQDKILHI